MQYKITKISPFKAAITVSAINFVIIVLYLIFSVINDASMPEVFPYEANKHNKIGIDFYISVLFVRNITIFIEVFIGCLLFNKFSYLWGGFEVALESKHSNQSIKADEK